MTLMMSLRVGVKKKISYHRWRFSIATTRMWSDLKAFSRCPDAVIPHEIKLDTAFISCHCLPPHRIQTLAYQCTGTINIVCKCNILKPFCKLHSRSPDSKDERWLIMVTVVEGDSQENKLLLF